MKPGGTTRNCCQCGAADREIVRPGIDSVHFVVPEIRYLSRGEEFQPKYRAKGWAPKVFQGRQAMWRNICVNCLNENEVRDRVWSQLKADAAKLEKAPNQDAEFYQQLVA